MRNWIKEKLISLLLGRDDGLKRKRALRRAKKKKIRELIESGKYKTMSYREIAYKIGCKQAQEGKHYLTTELKKMGLENEKSMF